MGSQKEADRGDGRRADLNHDRYLKLIVTFWTNSRMSRAELDELDRLSKLHSQNVWNMTANNDKESA